MRGRRAIRVIVGLVAVVAAAAGAETGSAEGTWVVDATSGSLEDGTSTFATVTT